MPAMPRSSEAGGKEQRPAEAGAGLEGGGHCLTWRELLSTSAGPGLPRLDLGQSGLPPGVTVRLHVRSLVGFQVELRLPGAAAPGAAPRFWLGQAWSWLKALLRRRARSS